eukprot:scaffold10570_cov176-Amphora_coffeaeformis.AAC.23
MDESSELPSFVDVMLRRFAYYLCKWTMVLYQIVFWDGPDYSATMPLGLRYGRVASTILMSVWCQGWHLARSPSSRHCLPRRSILPACRKLKAVGGTEAARQQQPYYGTIHHTAPSGFMICSLGMAVL